MGLAPGVAALKTKARPSGERANEGTSNVVLVRAANSAFSGGRMEKLIESRGDEVAAGRVARNSVVAKKSAAATHPATPRYVRIGVASVVESPGSFNTSSIWKRPSAMSRSRCAGSFLRHLTMSD